MRIVVLDARTPLTSLRRELRYTLVRLRQRSWTKTWVTTFEALLKETETAEGELRKVQDALEDAEAELDEADLDLDRVVMYTAQLVRTELTGSLRTKLLTALFGSERPSDVIKPKLGEELARVKTWPAVLVAAPLAKIVAQKAAVEAVVKRCEDAEKALTVAQAAMAGCKVKTLGPLYDKVNGERQALGGEAKKQAFTGSGRDAGEGLFRSSLQKARPATIVTLREELAENEAQQQLLKDQLADLEAEQAADDAAAAAELQKAQAIRDLERQQAELEAKLAELKAHAAGR